MVDRVLALPEGTRLYLLAPIVRGRKGEYRKELAELQKKGFQRVKIDGDRSTRSRDAPKLDKKYKHDIDVVVDRARGATGPRHAAGRQLRDGAGLADGIADRRIRRQAAARRPRPRAPTSRRTRRTSASPSRRASPARSPASPSTRSSRGCSRSTRRPAPAPSATASAPSCASRPTSWCPTRAEPQATAPSTPGRKTGATSPYYEQTLEALAKHFKVSMTTPWERAAQARAATHPLRHRRRGRSTSSTRTARGATRPPSRSRA